MAFLAKWVTRMSSIKAPRPAKPSRTSLLRAEDCYSQNLITSALCRLPVELYLEITTYLEPADTLSLVATSQHFSILPSSNPQHTKETLQDFSRRLKRDVYRLKANKEVCKDISKLRHLLCKFCLSSHPRRMFDPSEAKKLPHTRECFGARTFRVCEHRELAFSEMQRLVRGMAAKDPCVILCDRPHIGALYKATLKKRVSCLIPESWYQYGYYCQTFYLTEQYAGTPPSDTQMRRALEEIDEYICPHLRTSDRKTYDLLNRGAWHTRDGESRDGKDAFMLACCTEKYCHTGFLTFRYPGEESVYFYVERPLGSLTNPAKKEWLAQTEVSVSKRC